MRVHNRLSSVTAGDTVRCGAQQDTVQRPDPGHVGDRRPAGLRQYRSAHGVRTMPASPCTDRGSLRRSRLRWKPYPCLLLSDQFDKSFTLLPISKNWRPSPIAMFPSSGSRSQQRLVSPFHVNPLSKRQADVVFGNSSLRGHRRCDIIEIGQLHPAVERIAVREAVH